MDSTAAVDLGGVLEQGLGGARAQAGHGGDARSCGDAREWWRRQGHGLAAALMQLGHGHEHAAA